MKPETKKPSFMSSLKQFFNDTPKQNDMLVFNEATFSIPVGQQIASPMSMSTKSDNKQNAFKIENDFDESLFESNEPKQRIENDYRILAVVSINSVGKPIENGYVKKQVINFPPNSTFKIVKPIKTHKSLMDYLQTETERHVALDGGWFYIMKQVSKDKFKVSSRTSLGELQQILIKQQEIKPTLRLIFNGKLIKRFYMVNGEQEQLFFLKLRVECQKHGVDFIY